MMTDIAAGGPRPVPGREVSGRPSVTDQLLLGLLALAPLILALISWPALRGNLAAGVMLSYSLPITAIEGAVILYALANGFSFAEAFRRVPGWARLALVLLVAVALATSGLAANPGHSMIRTDQLAVHLLFGFSAWHLLRTRWAVLQHRLWPWVVVGTCLYVVALIAWVAAVQDLPRFNWVRFSFGVVHIRQTGFYSAAGAAAALGLAATATSRRHFWFAVAAASLLLALSCWSGTRGSLFAVIVAMAAGLVALPAMRGWRAPVALVVSTVAGALLSLLHQVPHHMYGLLRISETAAVTGADELATGRVRMWTAAIGAILERPLFGYGESQFGVAVPSWGQFNHPHNIFLQVLVQWGLVGFACYFALAGLLVWRCLRAAREGAPDLVAPVLVAVALGTMSLYEGSLYHPYPYMMVALAAAYVLAARSPGHGTTA